MKKTLTRLAESVIDQATEIGIDAETLDGDVGTAGAEAIIALRDCQRMMNKAKDAIKLAIAQQSGAPASPDESFSEHPFSKERQ